MPQIREKRWDAMDDSSFRFQIYPHEMDWEEEEPRETNYFAKFCKTKGFLARCMEGEKRNAGKRNQNQ